MKKNIYIISIFAFVMSCRGDSVDAEATFTKYDWLSSCQWINKEPDDFNDYNSGEVVIINDVASLKKRLTCIDDLPQINFHKNSLIVASGITTSGIRNVESNLSKEPNGQLVLEVTVHLNITANIDSWSVAYLTSKISNSQKADLQLTVTDY